MEKMFTCAEAAEALGITPCAFGYRLRNLGFKKSPTAQPQYSIEEIIMVRDYEENIKVIRETNRKANVKLLKSILDQTPKSNPKTTCLVKTGFKIVL